MSKPSKFSIVSDGITFEVVQQTISLAIPTTIDFEDSIVSIIAELNDLITEYNKEYTNVRFEWVDKHGNEEYDYVMYGDRMETHKEAVARVEREVRVYECERDLAALTKQKVLDHTKSVDLRELNRIKAKYGV